MNGDTRPPGPHLVERASAAREELRAAHAAVVAASEDWGLRRDHPESRFVSSLLATQSTFADLVIGFAADLEAIAMQSRAAADAELARQHAARDETKFQLTQARGAVRDFQVEKVRLADEMLREAVPKLVKGVKDAVAVREIWVGRGRMLSHAAIASALAIGLFTGGYAWRTVQLWPAYDAAVRNSEGIEACKQTSRWVDSEGHRLCRLDAFTASEAEARSP